ncbi:MAG: hypothetical protein ACLRSW_00390 [Christensenellaceae bacterium]
MIVTSFAVTGGSVLFGGLLGVFTPYLWRFIARKISKRARAEKNPRTQQAAVKGDIRADNQSFGEYSLNHHRLFGLVVIVPLGRIFFPLTRRARACFRRSSSFRL